MSVHNAYRSKSSTTGSCSNQTAHVWHGERHRFSMLLQSASNQVSTCLHSMSFNRAKTMCRLSGGSMLVTSQSDHIFWRQSKRNGLCRAVARPSKTHGAAQQGGPPSRFKCRLKRTAGRREFSLSRACLGQQSVGLRALIYNKAFLVLRVPLHLHNVTHERCRPAPYTSQHHMRFACACHAVQHHAAS
jgi:hypothetical protein